ncbi:MAG: hypothetical protein NWF11_07090 [Candidatus Bathyarchaeota archaeon]|nr:hypothetical protein [Candidatus Bathyarchaeota archaeon]
MRLRQVAINLPKEEKSKIFKVAKPTKLRKETNIISVILGTRSM